MRRRMLGQGVWVFTTVISMLVGLFSAGGTEAFQTEATTAIIIDHNTDTVLFEKNADVPMHPASMSKLMTIYMVFEALEDGRIDLDDTLPVSQHAVTSVRGSTMFLDTRDRVRVEDLIRGIIVLSGNDACIVVAEALSPDGSEAGFAALMNERAREIGLTHSHFVNASGWPHDDHLMSARDLVRLTQILIRDFPQYYGYFAEKEFHFDGRAPDNRFNRNPLLRLDVPGADGLKTGYTSVAKYGIVGSAENDGTRVNFVLNGLPNRQTRTRESERIVGWYMRNFNHIDLYTAGDIVTEMPVWLGDRGSVPVRVDENIRLVLPFNGDAEIAMVAKFTNIHAAPIAEGQEVGVLNIAVPPHEINLSVPLFAAESVGEAGFIKRLMTASALLYNTLARSVLPADP